MLNMSLRAILLLAAITASIMIAITGGTGLYTLNEVEQYYLHIENINSKNVKLNMTIKEHLRKSNEAVYAFIVKSPDDSNSLSELNTELASTQRLINDRLEEKKKIESTEEYKQLVNSFIEVYRKYYNDIESYKSLANTAMSTKDKTALISFINNKFNTTSKETFEKLDGLIAKESVEEDKWENLAKEAMSKAHKWLPTAILVFSLSMIFIAVAIGLLLDRKIKSVSNKLLSQAEDLNTASVRIAEASTELTSGVTQQSAAIQETAAAMDEINAMIAKNAESSKKSENLAMTSYHNAEKGKLAVDSMINSINSINDGTNDILEEVTRSNKKISEIVEVINEIGNKTKVINDIVFQTKLLSFNASVEAARAGEYGKGFTVVAKEVGDLARMSGAASEEITKLLDQSIQKVQLIVDETKNNIESLVEKSRAKVESGLEVAQDSTETLNQIVENISDVRTIVSEIATASQEQSHGVAEVNKALGQLDQATQQNSQATNQNSVASENLKAQSYTLKLLVDDMIAVIDGRNNTSSSKVSTSNARSVEKKASIAVKKTRKTDVNISELKKISMAKEAAAKKSRPLLTIVEATEKPKTPNTLPSEIPSGDSPGFSET